MGFCETLALVSADLGPEDFCALRRLAAICLGVAIGDEEPGVGAGACAPTLRFPSALTHSGFVSAIECAGRACGVRGAGVVKR